MELLLDCNIKENNCACRKDEYKYGANCRYGSGNGCPEISAQHSNNKAYSRNNEK